MRLPLISALPFHLPTTLLVVAVASTANAQSHPPTLDTFTVVASRTTTGDVTRSVDVISRDDIARSSARTIADVLALRLGVDVYGRSAAQADVSMRGSSSDQVVVLVDGVRMTDAQSTHYTLDLAVPLAAVDHIEILRGGGSALYGPDAIGGVINIVTRPSPGATLAVRGGSFGTVGGAASGGAASGQIDLATSADYESSDGHRDGTDYRLGQGRVSITNRLAGGDLRTNLGAGVRDFGANAFYGPYNSVERTGIATADSRWDVRAGGWAVAASAGTRQHADHYTLLRDDPSVYQNRHYSWQSTGELAATTTRGPLALAVGSDVEHDQLSSARLGGRREWRAGVFTEGTFAAQSPLTVDVGARGDRSSSYGDHFSPSIGASYKAGDHVRFRANGGLGFRAPTWTERYYTDPSNQGDSTLQAERFRTAEAGMKATSNAGTADIAVFARHAQSLIDWVKPAGAPASDVWHATNVGTATYHGIEATLTAPAIAGIAASFYGSGTTVTDSQGAMLQGKYALRPITRQIGTRLARVWSRGVEASADVIDAQRAGEADHVTANVHTAWMRRAVRVTLDATNLTGAEWLDASGQRVAGRAVYLGLDWRNP